MILMIQNLHFDVGKNRMVCLLLMIMTSYSMFNVQSLIEQNFSSVYFVVCLRLD